MKRIAIFASGSGSNAENIIRYFNFRNPPPTPAGGGQAVVTPADGGQVVMVLCNNKKAGVIQRCERLKVECIVFDRKQFYESDEVMDRLLQAKIDLVVLAGFLWLIPEKMIRKFPRKIINIHPALLPQHGGKGFYGDAVHQAVIDAYRQQPSIAKATAGTSGITVHYVNERFDEGEIIFQKSCEIVAGETAASLAAKVHKLEYEYFPKVIEQLIVDN